MSKHLVGFRERTDEPFGEVGRLSFACDTSLQDSKLVTIFASSSRTGLTRYSLEADLPSTGLIWTTSKK